MPVQTLRKSIISCLRGAPLANALSTIACVPPVPA
jgi:hypothetical protein